MEVFGGHVAAAAETRHRRLARTQEHVLQSAVFVLPRADGGTFT